MKKILLLFIALLLSTTISYSHSGRTDSYGGHWNHSTGTYHYHSGPYAHTGSYTAPIQQGGVPIEKIEEKSIIPSTSTSKNTYSFNNTSNDNKQNNINVFNTLETIVSFIKIDNNTKNKLIGYLGISLYILYVCIFHIIPYIKKQKALYNFNHKNNNNLSTSLISSTKENSTKTINIIEKDKQVSPKQQTIYICPQCSGKLIIRNGKYGKFIGCSNYPYCKYTKSLKNKKY